MGDADHTQSTSRAQEGKRAQEGNEHKKATSTSDAREQLGSRVMERALRAELYSVRTGLRRRELRRAGFVFASCFRFRCSYFCCAGV